MGWVGSKGRCYLPRECEVRGRVAASVSATFRSGGFSEVVLPTLIHAGPENVYDEEVPVDRAYRFLDRQGNLLMLRPDMTPVVARFAAHMLGSSPLPLRLYYQGNVFRSEDAGGGKRDEFLQAGSEAIGIEDPRASAIEMVTLAVEALLSAGLAGFKLGLGHQTALRDVLAAMGVPGPEAKALRHCLSRRDYVTFDCALSASDLSPSNKALVARLVAEQDGRGVLECLKETAAGDAAVSAVRDLLAVHCALESAGLGQYVYLDLGLVRPFAYYTGIVVEGYVPGVGLPVLGGGAYSVKRAGAPPVPASGFALDVDLLASALLSSSRTQEDDAGGEAEILTVALPAGRLLDDTRQLMESAGIKCGPEQGECRCLVFPGEGTRVMVVRPRDVPTYVEQGAADLGVAGEDVLIESQKDVSEILDLKTGACRMVMAAPSWRGDLLTGAQSRPVRVATKYPVITADYFARKGIPVEIICLSGAVEVAPLAGLSDGIVDIASSGRTLRENGLTELDEVLRASARLVANRASLRLKRARIGGVVSALRRRLELGGQIE